MRQYVLNINKHNLLGKCELNFFFFAHKITSSYQIYPYPTPKSVSYLEITKKKITELIVVLTTVTI